MNKMALDLIRKAKKEGWTKLDLGRCGIVGKIPVEIWELNKLEVLILSDRWREPGVNKTSLSDNRGSENRISSFQLPEQEDNSTLFSPSPSGWKPVANYGLDALRTLVLASTLIHDLSFLTYIPNIQTLNLSYTNVSDISQLSTLKSLSNVDLSHSKIKSIAPLKNLHGLKNIDIRRTSVTDLTPLEEFIRKGINVDLEYEFGTGILIRGCPINTPPIEIANRGNEAILEFWDEQKHQDTRLLNEVKLLIVGEGGTGKTTLVRRLFSPDLPMPTESDSTRGISITQFKSPDPKGNSLRINAWDFGGQEIYHATHQFFLTKRALYVLVDDTRKDDNTNETSSFHYWLEIIELLGGDSPVLIFQNEKSGRVKGIDHQGLRSRFRNVFERLYSGDLIKPLAAEEFRLAIIDVATKLPHVGDLWPMRWFDIRQELERIAGTKPTISVLDYVEIYSRFLSKNLKKALSLSSYLHDLGVVLHFQDDPLLSNILILRNSWATKAVYDLLDDESVSDRNGYFDQSNCDSIWNSKDYIGKHSELRQLMLRFELCYEIRDRQPKTWLAPQLLPQSPPLNSFRISNKDLIQVFRYEVLPKGIVNRLMVRMNRYVMAPKNCWRNGVVFEYGKSKLLAEIPFGKKEIHLRAQGENAKILMILISEDLDALNGTFIGLSDKVTKHVPCPCDSCKNDSNQHFFNWTELIERKSFGTAYIECSKRPFEKIQIDQLIEGIGTRTMINIGPEENFHGKAKIQEISIFLASSKELSKERREFEIFINRENKHYINQGIFFRLELWEDFVDTLSQHGLQEEYNRMVRESDIFLCLFQTKVGRFTRKEFETAFGSYLETGKPYIWTYFNSSPVEPFMILEGRDTVSSFVKLLTKLKHYYSRYSNIDDLKHQFSNQLRKVLPELTAKKKP